MLLPVDGLQEWPEPLVHIGLKPNATSCSLHAYMAYAPFLVHMLPAAALGGYRYDR